MVAMFCYFKGCTRCDGDLIFDEGDWRCWQCGQYYYAIPDASAEESYPQPLDEQPTSGPQDSASDYLTGPMPEEEGHRSRRRGYGARAERNINSVVRAKATSDERWWARNRQIIEYLDRGVSVREVARLVGKGERQIRVVRERLTDLRAATEE